jgi:predicted transcriptional regulator
MPLSRVTITISPELLDEADRRAHDLGRSRSWVLGEALGQYLRPGLDGSAPPREGTATYHTGLGASRRAQLEADLGLTPEERVVIAEQTAVIAGLRGRRPKRDQVISFDRYEAFLDWREREALDP